MRKIPKQQLMPLVCVQPAEAKCLEDSRPLNNSSMAVEHKFVALAGKPLYCLCQDGKQQKTKQQ